MMETSSTESTTALYLQTLPAIRERCQRVWDLGEAGKLDYFDYHPEKEQAVVDFCVDIIQRDYKEIASIPPHGRWRHIDAGQPRVDTLVSKFQFPKNLKAVDRSLSACRRLIDLIVVSVLLDAGAGAAWSYQVDGVKYTRSEGLGVASAAMFESGMFSGDKKNDPYRVDSKGLASITVKAISDAMQVSPTNMMVGIEGRSALLINLSQALESKREYFGLNGKSFKECGEYARPGNILDFLIKESIFEGNTRHVPVASLWHALIDGFASIWPQGRASLGGTALGDVWPCEVLKSHPSGAGPGDDLVPFHKLTGWLAYSIMDPIQKFLGWKFDGIEDMTGLPEYRNGGLLVDFGVLTLRPQSVAPRYAPSHPAIIEWRALTVIELDRIADGIRKKLGVSESELTLAQILEAATWKGGREIAQTLRKASGGGPPIEIESDGTVF